MLSKNMIRMEIEKVSDLNYTNNGFIEGDAYYKINVCTNGITCCISSGYNLETAFKNIGNNIYKCISNMASEDEIDILECTLENNCYKISFNDIEIDTLTIFNYKEYFNI